MEVDFDINIYYSTLHEKSTQHTRENPFLPESAFSQYLFITQSVPRKKQALSNLSLSLILHPVKSSFAGPLRGISQDKSLIFFPVSLIPYPLL
jgi:hypothetical protein